MTDPAHRAFDLSRYQALGPALADAGQAYRSNPFLNESNRGRVVRRLTFDAFRREADRLRAALHLQGLRPGDRLAIAAANGSRWLLAAYAAIQSGLVLIPLDARLDPQGQAAQLSHCRPRVLFTDAPTWARLGKESIQRPELVVVHDPAERPVEGPAMAWDVLLAAGDGLEPPPTPALHRDDVATIVYSSGTSGQPKGCQLTHGNYLSQLEVLATLFPLEEDDVYLSILPTNHAIDFMCGFLVPLLCGAQVVHVLTLRPEWITQACRDHRVTHMSAVPAILQAFERKLRERLDGLEGVAAASLRGLRRLNGWLTRRRPNHRVSRALLLPVHQTFGGRLRRIFAGGAFVPSATARFFYELGLPVAIGYGLTEACAVVSVNDLEPFRPDTVGAPVVGTEIRLEGRDETGTGEVWIRGPQVFAGYLDDPQATAEALRDGWLVTGDLGQLDAAGHLKLVGRKKNMVVTAGGKNVYPEDVEARFTDLPVEEHAVVAAHAVWGGAPGEDEALVLVARPRAGVGQGDLLGLIQARDRRARDYQRLGGVLLTDLTFPRTTSLKVKRGELCSELSTRHARGDVIPSRAGRPA